MSDDAAYPDIPYHKTDVHGFVALVDHYGSDERIADAARVSYSKGTKTVRDNQGLLSYLNRNRHTSPFEMCEMVFLCRHPIFVARQWIRHRTANVNEYSGRYSEMRELFWLPEPGQIASQSTSNRQGRKDLVKPLFEMAKDKMTKEEMEALHVRFGHIDLEVSSRVTLPTQGEIAKANHVLTYLPEESAWRKTIIEAIGTASLVSHSTYKLMLGDEVLGSKLLVPEFEPVKKAGGVARELARVVLPLNQYTEWYWKLDLHNLMHFLRLRLDPHAQVEIRLYAEAIADFFQMHFPLTYQTFMETQGVANLTKPEWDLVQDCVMVEDRPDILKALRADQHYTDRRLGEFCTKMGWDWEYLEEVLNA